MDTEEEVKEAGHRSQRGPAGATLERTAKKSEALPDPAGEEPVTPAVDLRRQMLSSSDSKAAATANWKKKTSPAFLGPSYAKHLKNGYPIPF